MYVHVKCYFPLIQFDNFYTLILKFFLSFLSFSVSWLQLKKKSHPSCLPSLSLTYAVYLLSLREPLFPISSERQNTFFQKKSMVMYFSVSWYEPNTMVWITELLTHKLRKSSNAPALRHIERPFFSVFFFNVILPETHIELSWRWREVNETTLLS